MSKYFMYGTELQEFEKLMMLVPNFLPRGSGVIVQKKQQNKNESIRCPDCDNYVLGHCSGKICGCFSERLAAGMICYETIVENCYREFKSYRFKRKQGAVSENCDNTYKHISEQINELKKAKIQHVQAQKKAESYQQRVDELDKAIKTVNPQVRDFDQELVKRLINSIRVSKGMKIEIQFHSGIVMTEEVDCYED